MNRNAIRILAVLAALIVAGYSQLALAQADATPEDLKQIDDLRQGLVRAFNNRQVDEMLTYLDPNVVVVWQNGEFNHGRDAVKQFYNRMMVGGVVKSTKFDPAVEGRTCRGTTCVFYGNLQDELTLNDGSVLPFHSRYSATLIKTDGKWLLTSFHASANVFDNPVTAIAVRRVSWMFGGGGLVVGLLLGLLLFRRRKA